MSGAPGFSSPPRLARVLPHCLLCDSNYFCHALCENSASKRGGRGGGRGGSTPGSAHRSGPYFVPHMEIPAVLAGMAVCLYVAFGCVLAVVVWRFAWFEGWHVLARNSACEPEKAH